MAEIVAVRERPILFSGEMVRAILDGRKTQTRRVVKGVGDDNCLRWGRKRVTHVLDAPQRGLCPYGSIGDHLWVRETWAEILAVSPASDMPFLIGPGEKLIEPPTSWVDDNGNTRWYYDGTVIAYRANSDVEFCDGDGFTGDLANRDDMPRWRSPIYMPRKFSRITLEIVSVHVELLQLITEAGARAEGEEYEPHHTTNPLGGYYRWRHRWNTLNGERGYHWDTNPWVWVIEFRRITDEASAP